MTSPLSDHLDLMAQLDLLKNFVIEASYFVPGDVAAKNGSLEYAAIRASWLKAVAALGMTENQVREQAIGAWKRGLAQRQREENR